MSFTNVCSIPIAPFVFGDMCKATITEARTFAIVNALATAFLGRHVKGQAGMDPYLSDPHVKTAFPEVAYVHVP
jgi:hypothetical protein